MANTIELAKKYLPLLDEVYKVSAKSSILDAPGNLVRESINAKEVLIPSIVLDGLGDYSRANGYVAGDADFTWETHTFTQDRGRKFQIDAQDDAETVNMAFGATAGGFVRTKVVPEVDAYRFAKLASLAPVGNKVAATLDKATALTAIDAGKEVLMNNEVDPSSIVTFVSPKVYTLLKQSDQIVRQLVVNAGPAVINREIDTLDGSPLVVVPQGRFYSAIDILSGGAGEEAGGYAKADLAKDLNFILVDTNAVLGITKVALPRIFDPETNQGANAWMFDFRLYHDLFVPANKVAAIYVHTVA